MTRPRIRTVLALTATVGIGLAACGGDNGGSSSATTGAATTASAATTAASADGGAFCTDGPAIDTVLSAEPPDPAAIEAALVKAEESAPDKIKAAVTTATAAVRTVVQTQDFSAFETPEVTAAVEQIDRYYVSDCGFTEVKVIGTDYAFAGVPQTLPAGGAVFQLTNNGAELHEAQVYRVNDGVTETLAQLVALPEEQGRAKTTPVGGAFAFPGATGSGTVQLDPGRYLVLCLIPVGLTPAAAEQAEASGTEPTGPPHITAGMATEFTVQ